jgi:hypothetical protein
VMRNAPKWDMEIVEGVRPKVPDVDCQQTWADNTYKLGYWVEAVENAQTGDRIILTDCDMLCLKDPIVAFDNDFDIAVTVRNTVNWLNAGVIFIRVNNKSRRFMRRWLEHNNTLFRDPVRRKQAIDRHVGMNQSALVQLLDHPPKNTKIAHLPCDIFNACEQNWERVTKDTVFLHIKSALREVCLGCADPEKVVPHMRPLVLLWRQYLNTAKEVAA